MALTVGGFDVAGGVTEADWSLLSTAAGARYAVAGTTDFQVTARPAASLVANIAAGVAYGCGVRVTNDAQITTTHSSIGSGTRWDAIVLRRDWSGVGGTASIVVIPGTSTRAIPSGGFNTPGTKDDQVLALVQITAGQSLFTQVIDMRWFPSKVVTVADLLAVRDPHLGQEANVLGVGTAPDTRWRYQLDPTGTAAWAREDATTAPRTLIPGVNLFTQAQMITTPIGWSGGSLSNRAIIDRNWVYLDIELRLTGTRISADANGNFQDQTVATIDSAFTPNQQVDVHFNYFGGGAAAPTTFSFFGGSGYLNPSGFFNIVSGASNIYINTRPSGDVSASLRAHVSYMRSA